MIKAEDVRGKNYDHINLKSLTTHVLTVFSAIADDGFSVFQ